LKLNISQRVMYLSLLLIVLIIGISIGFFFSPLIKVTIKAEVKPKPIIGILSIYGYMITDDDRELYVNCIKYAYQNNSIIGVIVRIDSPGGYATIVEDIYYSIKKLREKKPVIAVIEGLAASGGYYVALACDEIISVPTAFIGNIGVILRQPYIVIPSESIIESGPYKYAGLSLKETPFTVRKALNNFLNAVNESRGNKLEISFNELTLGKLYLSSEALNYGLIDSLGSYVDAISKIIEKTNVKEYVTIDLNRILMTNKSITTGQELWSKGELLTLEMLESIHPEPISIYYLSPYYLKSYNLLEPIYSEYQFKINITFPSELFSQIDNNTVLIDISHGNIFTYELLGKFFGKITEYKLKVTLFDISKLQNLISNYMPKALIIISPRIEYSSTEIKAIRKYVENGGKLILIYEPSIASSRYINSIAKTFGIHFSDGYLYDLNCNYGVHRNIILREFKDHPLTRNIHELTMLTASHIYGGEIKLAYTLNTTKLILTDVNEKFNPIVKSGNVIAIADLTFLLDPFVTLSDNEVFMENLVEYIKYG